MDEKFEEILKSQQKSSILPFDPDGENPVIFDFTDANLELRKIDPGDSGQFSGYVNRKLKEAGSRIGIGGYGEDRTIYRHSSLFAGGKIRSLHLGVDLWLAADTSVLAAFSGRIHSFRDNRGRGDYGPTIILEHEIDGLQFFTLYGHLSRKSLSDLEPGLAVSLAQPIGTIGGSDVNGGWPAHLHFQVIRDLEGRSGDFPGVCAPEDRAYFMDLCPDPNLVLKLSCLETR